MKGDDLVLAEASAGATDVPDHDAEAASRDEDALAFLPDLVDLVKEPLVVVEVAELAGAVYVLDEVEVGRRGHDQVDGLVL